MSKKLEYVGNVIIDTTFYNDKFVYSDGDIENELLDIVSKTHDYTEAIFNDNRYPILYHLASERENILSWYPFIKGSSILEVGAGCGGVTGALLGRGCDVTSNDISLRRSRINALRHSGALDLTIKVCNLLDLEFDETFDYVTCIGVMEYANLYCEDTDNPNLEFLKHLFGLLKPGGHLLLAIENKFGLKYWAGCREDHTGRYFDGLEGYPESSGSITFGKNTLTKLLNNAGFDEPFFHYPYPDYKLPNKIYSQEYLPKYNQLASSPNYDQERMQLFNEKLALNELIEENQFEFFANSFFIDCIKADKEMNEKSTKLEKIIFSTFNNVRLDEYNVITSIVLKDNKKYAKKIMLDGSVSHLKTIYSNFEKLQNIYPSINIPDCFIEDKALYVGFIKGQTLEERLLLCIHDNDMQSFIKELGNYKKLICSPSNKSVYSSEEFSHPLGYFKSLEGQICCENLDVDMGFANIILGDMGYTVIDTEWVISEPTPLKYLAYRAINGFYENNGNMLDLYYSKDKMLKFFNVYDFLLAAFSEMEQRLQILVYGPKLKNKDRRMYDKPIKSFNNLDENENLIANVFWDYGEGYSAENRIDFNVSLKENTFLFNMDNCSDAKFLRFDPMQFGGIIGIKNITLNLKDNKLVNIDLNLLKSNGKIDANKRMIKAGHDPQIYLDLSDHKNIVSVRFNYNIEFIDYNNDALLKELYDRIKDEWYNDDGLTILVDLIKGKFSRKSSSVKSREKE